MGHSSVAHNFKQKIPTISWVSHTRYLYNEYIYIRIYDIQFPQLITDG